MAEASQSQASPSGLYHFIWRWHFIAGLLVAPIVIILAATGGFILFKNEIESVIYAPLVRVEPSSAPVAASVQEAAALAAYPGAHVTRYTAPIAPDRAAEFSLQTADGRSLTAFVDPGDGALTGAIDNGARLSNVLTGLHGELLAGRWGDYLVEFAGCWAFVLLVTGSFLWWPRKRRRVGVLAPKLSARGRGLWRELHAVPAAWNAPLIAFLILSGLPWSSFWGENLARLGTIEATAPVLAPTPNFLAAPNAPAHAEHTHSLYSERHHAELGDNPEAADLPWSIRQAPAPRGGDANTVDLDWLVRQGEARGMTEAVFRVIYPTEPGGVFTLSYVPDRAEGQRTVHIDPADGAVLQDVSWEQYSPLGKAVEFGVETHVGRQFGAFNLWLMLASCVLLILTIGFGVAMWWSRRLKGGLGIPPVPKHYRPAWPILAAAIALGVLFPLVGVSMLLIAAIDGATRAARSGLS